MTTRPLALPDSYNPQTYLLKNITDNGIFHESRKGAAFAAQLVANGTDQDLELAEKVLGVVLGCQERDVNDPHVGNFYWMLEDDVVQDLNAVEFCLEYLIPMMLQNRARLAKPTQTKVLEAIRLGLAEVAKLDVLVAYSNIALLDIMNTCLGGELLDDPDIRARGQHKLVDWLRFTDSNGTTFEHNSPTYTAICLKALKRIADYVPDEATVIRARTALARLGLSAFMHIHKGTGRWAGPHSRAYHPSILCETPPELELVQTWLNEDILPAWLEDVLNSQPPQFEVTETASADQQLALTTYQTPEFAFGVSSKEYSGQSNVISLHYTCPTSAKPGVVYTRYLTNEKWLGDFYHATDRSKSRNIVDEGMFYGVQHANKAIGLYTLARPAVINSAKLSFIVSGADKVDEVWLDGKHVPSNTFESDGDELVIITISEVYIAIKPLTRTQLGKTRPMRLVERGGDLVLDLYNYLGSNKSFWELDWPHFFHKGKVQCGIYMEVAKRTDYVDARAFRDHILSGTFTDDTADAFTFAGKQKAGQQERCWSVSYARDGEELGIEVDLMQWQLKRRWTHAGELDWPMLEAPFAQQNATGLVECNGATLECNPASAWLYASPERDLFVAAYHGDEPSPLKLTTPTTTVTISSMGFGMVVLDRGELQVDALELGDVRVSS
ncbi:MAG: hypothetical protein AAF267_18040 [Deinococcota bacterium]